MVTRTALVASVEDEDSELSAAFQAARVDWQDEPRVVVQVGARIPFAVGRTQVPAVFVLGIGAQHRKKTKAPRQGAPIVRSALLRTATTIRLTFRDIFMLTSVGVQAQ